MSLYGKENSAENIETLLPHCCIQEIIIINLYFLFFTVSRIMFNEFMYSDAQANQSKCNTSVSEFWDTSQGKATQLHCLLPACHHAAITHDPLASTIQLIVERLDP